MGALLDSLERDLDRVIAEKKRMYPQPEKMTSKWLRNMADIDHRLDMLLESIARVEREIENV